MQAEERQFLIEQHLQKVEFASLEELSERGDVSVSTVRRDLTLLEAKGALRRTHGGARLVSPKSDEFAFTARDTHQLDEKEVIGEAVGALIHPNQGVIMAQDGVATFRASGVGASTADGGSKFRGAVYFDASAPSLSRLNGIAVVYKCDVDAAGNATWELWEWK